MPRKDLRVMLSKIYSTFANTDETQLGHVAMVLGPLCHRFKHELIDGNPPRNSDGLQPTGNLVRNRERHHPLSLRTALPLHHARS